jgi:hypothetical protein
MGELSLADEVWQQQSIWAQTANRMKASMTRARARAAG